MKTPNPERDQRIEDEVLVDAYGEHEVKSSWECYLSDKITFPFTAKIKAKNKQGEEILTEVEVIRFDEKSNLRVMVAEKNSEILFSVRLLDLKEVKGDFDTRQGINDWKYWKHA